MHDINKPFGRYATATFGMAASMVLLGVSAYLNAIFMYRLGRTHMDGMVYAAGGVAMDVLLALAPFFFFAAWKNREWTRSAVSVIVWIGLLAFSAQSAIGHFSASRTEASSSQQVTSTQYLDARKGVTDAEDRLKWMPKPTRPVGTIQAAIEKAKINAFWIQSNECNHPYLPALRKYCADFKELLGELSTAQAYDAQVVAIDKLRAKSDTIAGNAHGGLGETDPGARTISRYLGIDLSSTQSLLSLLGALVVLLGASMGPYMSMATLQPAREPKEAKETKALDDTSKSTRLLPAPDPIPLEAQDTGDTFALGTENGDVIEWPRGPAVRMASAGASPSNDAADLLLAIGLPRGPCNKRDKDDRSVLAWRFAAWLACKGHIGDYTPDQVDILYESFCREDNREPWATRVLKAELQALKPLCAWTSNPRQDDGTRSTVWTIKPPSVLKLTDILRRKGIASALPFLPPTTPPTAAATQPETQPEAEEPPARGKLLSMFGRG